MTRTWPGAVEPEGPGRGLVEDLEDLLDLQEVVARAERAELGDAPLQGPFGDVLGRGVLHPAALLGPLEVLLPAVAVLDGPLRALDQDVLEHGPAELRDAALPHPGRDLPEDLGQQLLALGRDVVLRVIRPQETDAAVDVVADPARRDDPLVEVEGRDAADREAVALVGVGHDVGPPLDAGQAGDVAGLGERLVAADVREEPRRGVDAGRDAHRALGRDLPGVVVDLLQVHGLAHMSTTTWTVKPSQASILSSLYVTALTSP